MLFLAGAQLALAEKILIFTTNTRLADRKPKLLDAGGGDNSIHAGLKAMVNTSPFFGVAQTYPKPIKQVIENPLDPLQTDEASSGALPNISKKNGLPPSATPVDWMGNPAGSDSDQLKALLRSQSVHAQIKPRVRD